MFNEIAKCITNILYKRNTKILSIKQQQHPFYKGNHCVFDSSECPQTQNNLFLHFDFSHKAIVCRFRLKYHPEDSVKRKDEQMTALKKRVDVFLDLLKDGKLESVSVDCSATNELLKLLDTVVVKLEGGTEEDLSILEQEYSEIEKKLEQKVEIIEKKAEEVVPVNKEEGELESDTTKPENVQESEGEVKENGDEQNKEKEDEVEEKKEEEEEGEEGEEGEAVEVQNGQPSEEVEKGKLDEEEQEQKDKEIIDDIEKPEEQKEDTVKSIEDEGEISDESKKQKDKKRKRSYSGSSSSSSSSSSSESEDEKEEAPKEKDTEKEDDKGDKEIEKKPEIIPDDVKPEKPRALHKTTSIFLRNLAPTITRQEVEAMCARYDGFLRVALADPQPDRRWLRRGWVTFKRDANIKEICWNLNNIRLRDCELGAIVNRDLSRRIRPVNGITAHKQVVRSDIRISARVTLNLDTKAGLWLEDEDKKEKIQQTFGLVSNNPVLHNITDYLIEEASAEEEELLGLEPTTDAQDATTTVDRDDTLISVLDRIILYLRVVHSVDYYNHCEYPNEDEMPNRCGILHARGPPPTAKTDITQFIGAPIEAKVAPFLPEKPLRDENKNDSKLISLSLKDVDTEIDKFVQANTRELAKDKWLCPLSGKKFKGPDFVRKHIFNKHAEKIDEVRKEVEFFNNYLQDPKRPMLAEPITPKREEQPTYNHPPAYASSYGSYGPPRYYNQGYPQRPRGYPSRARGTGGDFRPVIHYRDLDAPREPEEFI